MINSVKLKTLMSECGMLISCVFVNIYAVFMGSLKKRFQEWK